MTTEKGESRTAALRQDAEQRLAQRGEAAPDSEADSLRLVHELQVHQIELEMQNETLRAAQAEIEAGQRFTDLYEFAPVAYFSLGRDGRIRRLNLAGAELLGAARSQLNGESLAAYVADASQPAFAAFLARILAGQGREACELSLLPAPPRLPVVAQLVGVRDETGQLCNLSATDISTLKRVEAELRQSQTDLKRAQAVACTGSWRLNVRRNTMLWSDESYRIFGLPPELPISYQTFLSTAHPADRARVEQAFAKTLLGEPCDIEHRIVAGGVIKWVRQRASPEYDAQGVLLGAFCTTQDITESKRVEGELRAARDEAERANNAKSRFLAAASHDLRQPLAALSLYVDVLGSRVGAKDAQLLGYMKGCVGSLGELLSNLLDISKLEAGIVSATVSDFPIAALFADLGAIHAPEALQKGLRLRCVSSRLIAHTDPVLLRRMLGNLVANAIRYTERGSVLVGCRRRQGKLWIEVWDTGIGIPADKTAEVFEEFRQVASEKFRGGSGLGLNIVAKMAALLGLEIRLNSRLGKGSMFAIEMPRGQAVKVPVADAVPPPLRIALVEDSADVRDALALALQVSGHQVRTAASGQELLAALAGWQPQILVSDYRLAGGETGFDVITAVRAAVDADLPAIIITGDTDPGIIRSMAARGILIQYKPLSMDALQASIAQLARGKSSSRDPGAG